MRKPPIPPAPKKVPVKTGRNAASPFQRPREEAPAEGPLVDTTLPPETEAPPARAFFSQEPAGGRAMDEQPPQEALLPLRGRGPPLFIKIDKYREVVNNLHILKTHSLSLRDALDALADLEKELQRGLSVTHRALDKFNSTIAAIDAKITRISPQDAEAVQAETEEMDTYVRDVNEQMDRIRKELKTFSR